MNAPTITSFRLRTDHDRTLHYAANPDLPAKLLRGGIEEAGSGHPDTRFVLVTLDLDGEACDVVEVDENDTQPDVETLDRAIAALQAAREGLLS